MVCTMGLVMRSNGQSTVTEEEVNDQTRFVEVTETHLPSVLSMASMDARPADVDGDGDLDIIVACEFCRNRLLINDGKGRLAADSTGVFPEGLRGKWFDAEAADFNGDGLIDLYFASQRSMDRLILGKP